MILQFLTARRGLAGRPLFLPRRVGGRGGGRRLHFAFRGRFFLGLRGGGGLRFGVGGRRGLGGVIRRWAGLLGHDCDRGLCWRFIGTNTTYRTNKSYRSHVSHSTTDNTPPP